MTDTKRPRYPHKMPKEYLQDLAKKLCTVELTEEITYNTLVDVFRKGYTNGYNKRQDEMARFRKQKERHLREGFREFKDELDDRIHANKNPRPEKIRNLKPIKLTKSARGRGKMPYKGK